MNSLESIEMLLTATFRILPPILLAGLGGMLSSRVGLLNMGLEGMMLIGSFTAVIASYYSGSAYIGLLAAMLAGAILGLSFALFSIKFKADNVVVGVALNMFALGITKYLLRILFGVSGAFSSPDIKGLNNFSIPLLDNIPILRSLNNQSILVYLSIILTFIIHYIIYKTPQGLRIRATGTHPMAVSTAGVKVNRLKYITITFSGLLSALGGAHLSLGQLTMFTDNMTNGRGFIAMAANIFGKNTPIGTFVGSLLFSFTDAITMRMQTFGFPPTLIQIIPYLITLITLYLVAIKASRVNRKSVDLNTKG